MKSAQLVLFQAILQGRSAYFDHHYRCVISTDVHMQNIRNGYAILTEENNSLGLKSCAWLHRHFPPTYHVTSPVTSWGLLDIHKTNLSRYWQD